MTGKVHIPSRLFILVNFLRSIWTATKCAISWIFHIFIESPVRFEDAIIQKLTFAISDFFRCNVPSDAPRSLFKPGETLLLDAFSVVFTCLADHVLSFLLEDATVRRFQRCD